MMACGFLVLLPQVERYLLPLQLETSNFRLVLQNFQVSRQEQEIQ